MLHKYKTMALLAVAGALMAGMSGCVVHHGDRPGHQYAPKPGHRYKPMPQGHRPRPPHSGPFGAVDVKIFDSRDRTA